MRKLLFILPLLAIAACGDDAEATDGREPVSLKTFEQKLSYSFGAMEAQKITESTNPNASRLDKKMLLEGFKDGFKTGISRDPNDPCMKAMESLFGIQGMDFDTTYLVEGSKCYGLTMAGMFYEQLEGVSETGRINKELLFRGFQDGLEGIDTILSQEEKLATIEEFSNIVREKMMAEQETMLSQTSANEAADWEAVKAKSGLRQLADGVYIETLKEGSGELPQITDDVEVSYLLTDIGGTFIQNSDEFGEHFKTNLSGSLYRGWVTGLMAMKKGGKYKIYVPAAVADGQRSLIFEMEVFNIGPAGSLAPPQQ